MTLHEFHRAGADPAAFVQSMDSRACKFETPCGTGRMVWRSWGEGSPLVLLHGGSGSWLHWITTIPALALQFTVWAPDLPGFGESDVPSEPYTLEHYVDVVEAGLKQLLPGPSTSFDLVGFSLGASVAVRLAHLFGDRLRHLVLSGANFFPPMQGRRMNLAKLKGLNDPEERARRVRNNIKVMMVAHNENVDPLALHLYDLDCSRRRLPRVPFSGFTSFAENLAQARFQGRFTVISGTEDQVIGHGAVAQAERLRSLRPEASYHALERAGHWVMYEARERYNRLLLESLNAR